MQIPDPATGTGTFLADIGRQLIDIHILKAEATKNTLFSPYAQFPIAGSNRVDGLRSATDKVYINDTQYFDNVPETAWNFFIGGYQPAQKWLKDRKGRTLSDSDAQHYQSIITALLETSRLMSDLSAMSVEWMSVETFQSNS